MESEIHIGDIGTVFLVTVQDNGLAVDISTATTKELCLRKPDGTLLTKNADFNTDGVDGKLKYTTISGDLDAAGNWILQIHIVMPTGEWRSDKITFAVYPNIS